ncbi:AAA family ATPase [Anoxybacillus ayderensis]|uniref:AAA family ATPase n=1 Tax=Anoxybacillus ayderensis TaxID=265546 RepID=UPI002E1B866D|nr:AAA family ATPase [Anoxybacillus ayderensis]
MRMEQSWALKVERFGKIKRAEIEIAPLMLFVGENNSGKSYMMSLLWGLLSEARKFFPKEPSSSQTYQEIDRFLERSIGNRCKIGDEEAQLFIQWFNDILRNKKSEFIKTIFRRKIPIGSLTIERYHRIKPLEVIFEKRESLDGTRFSSGKGYIRIPYTERSKEQVIERYRMAQYITWNLLMDELTSPLYPLAKQGRVQTRAIGEALYLPASRTGFMLSYKAVMQDLMERLIAQEHEEQMIEFTLPVYRFLQALLRLDESGKSKYEDIGQFIEEHIMHGTMRKEKETFPSFYYCPKGKQEELPLYVTSSLVTELSPLILFLKSKTTYRSLFFEEAEAHLHPRVQRILATALVKLVNRGMPVWLTTHSDILFQQVNNLIKLHQHPKREVLMQEYGYTAEDLLDPKKVKAYQFHHAGHETVITPLVPTENGFPAETFNDVILDLNEETYAFQIWEEDEREE